MPTPVPEIAIDWLELGMGLFGGLALFLAGLEALSNGLKQAARDLLLLRQEIAELADRLFERHTRRLRSDDPNYLERVRLLMSFIEQLRHMYIFARRIAAELLPGELRRETA